jgi:hypothetical protein
MDYEYNYEVTGGAFAGVMIVIWLFAIVWAVLTIIGLWKTLNKAGLPGWAAIIPFYNEYNIVKMSNRPIWFFWAMLGCSLFAWIPFLGWLLVIALIVLWVFVALDIAANFGQGTGFAILLIIFPAIMFLVLGFGSAQFNRIAAPGSAGFGAPPMPAGGTYGAAPPAPPAGGGYATPAAPPAPPAAPVTPGQAPAAPVTPPDTAAAPETPSGEDVASEPETPQTPPPAPPAGSPPPPPPLS